MDDVRPPAGYEEVPHTADWALRVWAPNLPALFQQAVVGMYALAGVVLAEKNAVEREVTLSAPDAETLLVAFLSELLYVGEQEHLAFPNMALEIAKTPQGYTLRARLRGSLISSLSKAIKAVTFHNLRICSTPQGLETEIVFDV